jgi:hypothetical protein
MDKADDHKLPEKSQGKDDVMANFNRAADNRKARLRRRRKLERRLQLRDAEKQKKSDTVRAARPHSS